MRVQRWGDPIASPATESNIKAPRIWPPSRDAEVRLVRRDQITWAIEYDSRVVALRDVLKAASNDRDAAEHARAWSVLGQLTWSQRDVEQLVDALHEYRDVNAWELVPLLAPLAVRHGEIIARLFPDHLDWSVAALCGRAGVVAAERELRSGNPHRRGSAIGMLDAALETGWRADRALVLEALAVERNTDNVDTLQALADALKPRGEPNRHDEGHSDA